MQIIEKIDEMQAFAKRLCASEAVVALVPTMGSLHEGHLSLIKTARERAQQVVVSIFVNPKQFGPSEDFATYPRDPEQDLQICREAGVDVVFMPDAEELYPKDYSTYITEETISKVMCGISRPQHFRGVTTVVGKLFNLVRPDFAVFGQKDAQQVAIIKKMVRELHFGVEIVVCATVREEDGLAKSSRNRYLSKVQRSEAAVIPQSLETARAMVEAGTQITDRVIAEVTHILGSKRRIRIIYITMTDPETMEPLREIVPGKTLLSLAVWVDEVRLIDNILL